jgi:hypothetical protein
MAKPSKPIVLPEIHLHIDIPGELAVISAAKNPCAALGDLLGRLAQGMFANGYAAGATAMAEVAARSLPKLKKLRGARPVAVTLAMPVELTAALARLAEPAPTPPTAPAPIINVSPTPVTIQNTVEVPSRTVLATPRADGSVLMVPQP